MQPHPYSQLPDRNWWRKSVPGRGPGQWPMLYTPKFQISKTTPVSAAGSCFAQHIGRALRTRGYNFMDFEPAPSLLPTDKHDRFSYGVYSARFGNIYTARQLLQLAQRAFGKFVPHTDHWEQQGRYFDPFRPNVEPGGFGSLGELRSMQASHLGAVRKLFKRSHVFIFTLGLTEAWLCKRDGAVYPICPGTSAGKYNAEEHGFCNFTSRDVVADLHAFVRLVRRINQDIRIIFTVSPVPLIATASEQHVLVATTYSKSVLRAAAGELASSYDHVDYFPSYEIITAPASRGSFYVEDLREVTSEGVETVMSCFFGAHDGAETVASPVKAKVVKSRAQTMAVECDEEKLEQFAP